MDKISKYQTEIIGKTISEVRQQSINAARICFTDGSFIDLWAELGGLNPLPYLVTPGFNVDTVKFDE